MRVLISGGGIAGLTLAYWLQQYHIPAVVIEQANTIRRDGYAIDFFGTGYDVASRMGLLDQLRSRQIPFEALVYVNKDGKTIARLDMRLIRKLTEGKYMGLMHETLEEVLYEALEGSVEVRFGRWIECIEADPDTVEVTFNDGATETFDLLIGADGVHSKTRALVFGLQEQFSRYLGYTIACYPTPDRYGIGKTFQMYNEPGRMVAAYCTPQTDDLLLFFMYQSPKPEHVLREQRLSHLRKVFASMGWLTEQFLSDVDPEVSVFMDAVIQIQMRTWHQGRVALVGDACDCPTLLSGQGASLAMGGAYLLAKALHDTADYQEAFRRYEQQMSAYVLEQQKSGRSFAKSFLPGSPLGLFVQQAMLKVLFREAFGGLLRRQLFAPSILPVSDAKPDLPGESPIRSRTADPRLPPGDKE
ncbi:oxidoreductase [Reticulibacter mediterranei]|uniref:Oxidoreductase n=1 Tax=Reticulibacter mediterranei TaxID=2778369 RepID=A0A8J3ID10_9CHLR|nr:FAD-dependent monooxygenase [Reticulibacter mediterranei]GHO90253.1 oxidoreductase [Reticulibacter mediterranei]